MLRSATAKIVYPFLKESSRHSDLDKFWQNPFSQPSKTEDVPMTEEDRMKSISKLLKKLSYGEEEKSES